jgi:hypothetical protein
LRNPIERAYSAFNHLVRDNREPLRDFGDALDAEPQRARDGWEPLWHYVAAGRYLAQVQEYLDRFAADQIHIELFERLVVDEASQRRLYDFLGVSWQGAPLQPRNVSGTPRRPGVYRLLSARSNLRLRVRSALPDPVINRLTRWRDAQLVANPPLDTVLRERLREEFVDEVAAIDRELALPVRVHWPEFF